MVCILLREAKGTLTNSFYKQNLNPAEFINKEKTMDHRFQLLEACDQYRNWLTVLIAWL
jgi:hypothetical protein